MLAAETLPQAVLGTGPRLLQRNCDEPACIFFGCWGEAARCAAQCTLSNGSHDKFHFEFNARDIVMSPEKLAFCSGRENTLSFWFHFGLELPGTSELNLMMTCNLNVFSVECSSFFPSHSPGLLKERAVDASVNWLKCIFLVPCQTCWIRLLAGGVGRGLTQPMSILMQTED